MIRANRFYMIFKLIIEMDSFNKELSIYLLGSSEKSIAQRASKLINKCESAEFDITFPSASKLDIWTKCTNKSKNEIRTN